MMLKAVCSIITFALAELPNNYSFKMYNK